MYCSLLCDTETVPKWALEPPRLLVKDPHAVDAVLRIVSPVTTPFQADDIQLPEALHNAIAASIQATNRLRSGTEHTKQSLDAIEQRLSEARSSIASLRKQLRQSKHNASDFKKAAKLSEERYAQLID